MDIITRRTYHSVFLVIAKLSHAWGILHPCRNHGCDGSSERGPRFEHVYCGTGHRAMWERVLQDGAVFKLNIGRMVMDDDDMNGVT